MTKHVDLQGKSIWEVYKFPVGDMDFAIHAVGNRWIGYNKVMTKPYCWTPSKEFYFGGRKFIPLYPCAAWETKNFGWIAQKLWDRVTLARV